MKFRPLLKIATLLSLIGIGVVASWMVVDTGIHYTSDYEFCTSCHSHAPIGTSYRESLHGGNNRVGWRASCSNCHIPHDNAFNYLLIKAYHGVVDPTMELIKEPLEIDWHGNRENREHYVYDSGCLSCHKYLEQSSLASSQSFRPHRKYFSGSDASLTCVGCHEHVGHADLGIHLQEHGWELKQQ